MDSRIRPSALHEISRPVDWHTEHVRIKKSAKQNIDSLHSDG